MSTTVRTRIAPSPTGMFHIGTARTALLNYIFARQQRGEFLLRMEDTDKRRSKSEFEEDIKSGLKWLGLNWDGEVVYQRNNVARYLEIAQKLKKEGYAYEKEGALWFRVPKDEKIKFQDLVRGEVTFATNDIDDFVILRSDGTPIFYLSGVVDDHDSKITHVIRGEEHLSNTPKQLLMMRALGWQPPLYAHVPLILNEDRTKMSKRKDPVSITKDFQQKGYLAEALINFLILLGWHEREIPKSSSTAVKNSDIYSLEELIKKFDISRMQKGGAVFDRKKLDSINRYYLNKLSDKDYLAKISHFKPEDVGQDKFRKLALIFKDRINFLAEIEEELKYLEKISDYRSDLLIFKKSSREATLRSLKAALSKIKALAKEPDSFKTYDLILKSIVAETDLNNGDVFWSLRVALSGREKSPPPALLMWLHGRVESERRIETAINKLAQNKDVTADV